jgi:hypothetical protein
MAKHQPLLCFTPVFHLRRKGEIITATLFCPNLPSSPNGEISIAALFSPNLSSSPDRRNNNHFFVFLESFYLRRTGETSIASLFYPNLSSSPNGEIIIAALFCPNLYFFAVKAKSFSFFRRRQPSC